MSQTHDMPFGIMDVAELLHIRIRRPSGRGYYADCPFCGDNVGNCTLTRNSMDGNAITAENMAVFWIFTVS